MRPRVSIAHTLAIGIMALAAIVIADGALHALLAQNPFGGPRPAAAEPQVGGLVGWL